MNTLIRRIDHSAALRAAFGSPNAAIASAIFTNVLADHPLGAIAVSNNGLADALQAEMAQVVMTTSGPMYYHSAVYVRSTSYGAIPAGTMTAAQFDALVNPRGVEIPPDFAAEAGLITATRPAGCSMDALGTGLLGGYNPLTAYRPSATSPAGDRLAHAVGTAARMLGLLALVMWCIRLARGTILPLIQTGVRGAFGAASPRIGAKAW